MTRAVFFDVDFTLIHPGPRFQSSGYHASCREHSVDVDPALFESAVAGAARVIEDAGDTYDEDLYVRYTARIIELMGGTGDVVNRIARVMYDEWAENHHFELYDDVRVTLAELVERGCRVGLISNSHRCLQSFESHFGLDGLISVGVTSAALGYMKPHPEIFRTALERMSVDPAAAVMVGDSLHHDVHGARRAGMRAVWLVRGRASNAAGNSESMNLDAADVPTISTLRDLPALLAVQGADGATTEQK